MHVALVTCDHGLGHVRRSRIIANELAARGCKVTVLCPIRKWLRFDGLPTPANGSVEVIDFATHTRPDNLRKGVRSATHWDSRLPNLDAFDVVIGDNLPEVLSRRPDAVIVAQFFWHDVLDDIDAAFRERAQCLLREYQPVVYGSSMFAMPAVSAQPRFRGVGLFHSVESAAAFEQRPRTDLLLTGGSTPDAAEIFDDIVNCLVDNAPLPYETSWFDPQFHKAAALPNSQPATFDQRMFARLKLAICRPGLGVVTELIAHRVPMLLAYEEGNREMQHNAEVLVDLGLAIDLSRNAAGVSEWLDARSWWRSPTEEVNVDAAAYIADQLVHGGPPLGH